MKWPGLSSPLSKRCLYESQLSSSIPERACARSLCTSTSSRYCSRQLAAKLRHQHAIECPDEPLEHVIRSKLGAGTRFRHSPIFFRVGCAGLGFNGCSVKLKLDTEQHG
jgi:hypothetical protein